MKIDFRMTHFSDGIRMYRIPDGMIEGLENYFNHRFKQGGFLHAILCNDFMEAARCADYQNMDNMPAYAHFLYNFAPIGSYGSYENVERWLKGNPNETD